MMMSRKPFKKAVVLASVAVVALGVLAASAFAVVNGSPDNGKHPYVGMAVWFAPNGGAELCSGSLVSPTVFVTAAHCAPDNAVVLVDVQENAYEDLHAPHFGSGVPGIFHADPNWTSVGKGLSQSDRNDIAVVTLLAPLEASRYAKLPKLGYDDTLPNNQPIEIVGFGIQTQTPLTYGTRFDAPRRSSRAAAPRATCSSRCRRAPARAARPATATPAGPTSRPEPT